MHFEISTFSERAKFGTGRLFKIPLKASCFELLRVR